MNRFKKILFVADGTAGEKTALTKTIQLAMDIKAKVSVIDVIVPAENFAITDVAANMIRLQKEMLKVRKDELASLVKSARLRNSTLPIPVMLKEGKDFIEIIRTVQQDGFDLVIKASGKPHHTGLLFSTLDMSLVRKCPCPVLILKPRKKISHSKILAAVDLRLKDKTSKNMDRTVMELASSLASLEQGSLHILHAWHMAFEKRLKNRKGVQAAYKSLKTMLRDMRKVEKSHLDDLATEFALTRSATHLLKGEPDVVIPRFVKSNRIDLVVMGTVGRTGIKGLFMGNTAEKILNNINCSVLAIKPVGWKSPVG
ncbi:MAG: universal stress protein [Gammaproteobacteria bacterium]|jgi:nucleotide-binding universal stress UspA family protein|nr:universal stress protein [Gammaproteobacteria bacterium]MBT6042034.1 universal stress protein [Gammaproteobacteria bacterium]